MFVSNFSLSDLIDVIAAWLFLILDLVKNTFVMHFGFFPELKALFKQMPPLVYGVILFIAILIIIAILSAVGKRLYNVILSLYHGSSLSTNARKKKVIKEARFYTKRKEFARAADLYMSVDEDGLAAKVLEKGELYAKAGLLYDRMGQPKRAIEMFERGGDHSLLGEALMRHGEYKNAGDIFIKAGKKILAAEAYERANMHKEAADLFEETGHSLPAAEHFEKAGDIKKAAIFYDRTYVESTSSKEMSVDHIARFREYSMKAGRFYHETGDYEKAADAFSRVKAFNEAATSALAAGDKMKAAEFYETGREYEKAAEIFRERGNVRRAEQLMAEKYIAENDFVSAGKAYVNAGEFAGAAEYFERAGDYIAAGEAYLKENDYSSAGVMLMKGGQELRAAEAYEKNGDIRQAADIYEKLGDTDKAAALIEEFGDYFDASEMYRKAGQTAKALAALQKVSPSDPQYGMAVFKMAEFFKSQGKLDLAAEKFKQAIGTAEADFGNLEMYYGLATVYESLGRYSEAAGLFKNIQLVDYTFKDSGDRLKACEEKASQTPARTDSASSSGQVSGGTETRTKEASKRYAIMGEIGRGGMGIVYKAKDNNLNRIIALKLLPKSISENPKAVMRFSAEARSAAQLNHTNIVTLYDFQQAGGRSFITMEYVEGATLKKLMGMVDKLAISKALKIVYQCCQGLEYAHRKGIVHRDIKPSNIMISKQNVVKIMDFGLAKMAGDNTLSEAGTISGTLLYMSPEQLVGGKLDKKTDIYSLGLVLYELIAGGHPFAKGDAAYHHTHTVPEPPSALRPEIPENLDRITLKCLEKDPAKRFESALQLALALREVPLG